MIFIIRTIEILLHTHHIKALLLLNEKPNNDPNFVILNGNVESCAKSAMMEVTLNHIMKPFLI
jgi:hypothetical protein